jgi:FkbM family methyltransferase
VKAPRSFLRLLGHLNFIRFGVRDRILRYLHNPDTAASEFFEVDFYGHAYPGNFNNFIDWSVFYYGAYAREELSLIGNLLEPMEAPVVLDIGANVGHHSLFAATAASTVHSFEPFANVADKLKEKMARNRLANITLHEIGLGEATGSKLFNPPSANNPGTGTFLCADPQVNSLELRIERGDQYLEERKIDRVDLIKMDIEGFEVFALKGLRDTLQKFRPVCFFEWSQEHRQDSMEDGLQLFPRDYLFFDFSSERPVLWLFNAPKYSLTKLNGAWKDGNLLAVPKEYAERVNALNPSPTIARRLRGE